MTNLQSLEHGIPLPLEVPYVRYCSCACSGRKAVRLEMGFQHQCVLLRVGSPQNGSWEEAGPSPPSLWAQTAAKDRADSIRSQVETALPKKRVLLRFL